MTIESELDDELKDAMKTGDARRRDVIRQVRSEIQVTTSNVDFSDEVDDDLYRRVIASYTKRMTKSRDEYRELGDRGEDMAEQLSYEIDFLSQWLPSKLGEGETERIVDATIKELGVAGDSGAAGRVIGVIMKSRGSDLDGAVVNRLVRERLG